MPSIINKNFCELNKKACSNEYNKLMNKKESINGNDNLGLKLSILSSEKINY